jgi:hypothetical protein
VLVDTLGLVLHALVTAADVQDRDGGILLLATLFGQYPFLRKLFADSAYAGPIFHDGAGAAMRDLAVEIVKPPLGPRVLLYSPNVGSWSGPSDGSTGADASPKTGKTETTTHLLSCASLRSA